MAGAATVRMYAGGADSIYGRDFGTKGGGRRLRPVTVL